MYGILAAQDQFSGGNFHTNKDAGGMWCHSHRGLFFLHSYNSIEYTMS